MIKKEFAVFVPHELKDGKWIRVDDLPRFLEPAKIITYLKQHPNLASRRLDWIEHWDKESRDEYIKGVGIPKAH